MASDSESVPGDTPVTSTVTKVPEPSTPGPAPEIVSPIPATVSPTLSIIPTDKKCTARFGQERPFVNTKGVQVRRKLQIEAKRIKIGYA